jgi:isopentenyl diphosphate isomerase/L-lactate dehydrogenase-like FMN-dependent dehydrogenase
VVRLFELLRGELTSVMGLCGITSAADVDPSIVSKLDEVAA